MKTTIALVVMSISMSAFAEGKCTLESRWVTKNPATILSNKYVQTTEAATLEECQRDANALIGKYELHKSDDGKTYAEFLSKIDYEFISEETHVSGEVKTNSKLLAKKLRAEGVPVYQLFQ